MFNNRFISEPDRTLSQYLQLLKKQNCNSNIKLITKNLLLYQLILISMNTKGVDAKFTQNHSGLSSIKIV